MQKSVLILRIYLIFGWRVTRLAADRGQHLHLCNFLLFTFRDQLRRKIEFYQQKNAPNTCKLKNYCEKKLFIRLV